MTEAEWLACADPTRMLYFLRGKASDRKLRLFAVACCRSIWSLLWDERSRDAVKVAERFADCWATRKEQRDAQAEAEAAVWADEQAMTGSNGAAFSALLAIWFQHNEYPCANTAAGAACNASMGAGVGREYEATKQTGYIRDIFGNPFRPVAADPAWLTSTVLLLAQGIYEERAFDRMPILADALQDAGCENDDILNHCRGEGPHVRGCWVVDLVLGKS